MEVSPVSVRALSDAEVIMLPFERFMSPCQQACAPHHELVRRLMRITA